MTDVKKVLVWEALSIIGGGQRVSLQAAEALRKNDEFDCEFILPGEGPYTDAVREKDFTVHILPLANYSLGAKNPLDMLRFMRDTVRSFFRFRAIRKKVRPHVLYVGGPRALLFGALWGQLSGLPVVWHLHHLFTDKRTLWAIRQVGRLPAVKRAICVSNCVKEQHPALAKKTVVLYNGVDLERFVPDADAAGELRAELGVAAETQLLLCAGIIQRPKRQDVYVRAMPHVLKKHPDSMLLIAGVARENGLEFEKELHDMVAELGLEKQVKFLGFREDMPHLLAACNVLLLAMSVEACPLVILESCASGAPVIAPDQGGALELTNAGGCGLTYAYGDSKELADRIVELGSDRSLGDKFRQSGHVFAAENSLDHFGEKFSLFITQALGNAS